MQDREQSKMARGLGVEYDTDTDNESIDELGFQRDGRTRKWGYRIRKGLQYIKDEHLGETPTQQMREHSIQKEGCQKYIVLSCFVLNCIQRHYVS